MCFAAAMTGTICASTTGAVPERGEMVMRMMVNMSDSRATLKMGMVCVGPLLDIRVGMLACRLKWEVCCLMSEVRTW